MEVADPSETLINSTTLHGVISRGSNIIGHCVMMSQLLSIVTVCLLLLIVGTSVVKVNKGLCCTRYYYLVVDLWAC